MTKIICAAFMFLLVPAAFPSQLLAQMGQSKQDLAVPIKDLRSAPTEIVLDGRSLFLTADPWRDFMPTTFWGADGSPMMVVLRVNTSDKGPFPSGVRLDRAWVFFGEQVWETSKLRDPLVGRPYPKDSWINCSASPMCEATARNGPKWGPEVLVDVVVRLTDNEGRHHFLQVSQQRVIATH